MSDEQTDTTTEAIISPEVADATTERDAMIKAVEGLKPEAPANDEGAPPSEPVAAKKAEKVEPEAAPEAESKVGAVLRAREQAQKIRDEAAETKAELAQMRAEMAAERAAIAKEKEETTRERNRILALKDRPLEAIKELGWDTKQLVNEVTREGSPEWQAQKRLEAALEKSGKETAELRAWKESQEAAAKEHETQRSAYAKQQVEKSFLSLMPETSALRTLYSEAEIVAKGHAIADEYAEKSGGKVASLEELRDYMEEQAAKRLATIRGEQPGSTVTAAKPKANGPRTLSASSASERRTSPKPIRDMTPDEEYEALKAAAADAMRTSA